MFFLLRLAFWLGLVLVLLPREKTPESDKLPQISVSDAVHAATATVNDMSQFCKRQPQACEVGGQAATVIGARAEEGARKIYQSITDKTDKADKTDKKATDADRKGAESDKRQADVEKKPAGADKEKKAPEHTGSIDETAPEDHVLAEAPSQDTLTAQDLAVDWRGVP